MSRHLSDQPRTQGNARLREFTRQDRESGMHLAITALHRQPKDRGTENRRLAEFARIERITDARDLA